MRRMIEETSFSSNLLRGVPSMTEEPSTKQAGRTILMSPMTPAPRLSWYRLAPERALEIKVEPTGDDPYVLENTRVQIASPPVRVETGDRSSESKVRSRFPPTSAAAWTEQWSSILWARSPGAPVHSIDRLRTL